MPYEIETKDGIVIRNIPDDIPADSIELKQRVELERQRLDSPKPKSHTNSVRDLIAGTSPPPSAAANEPEALASFAKSIGVNVAQLLNMPSNLVNWMLKKASVPVQMPGTAGVLDAGLSVASSIAAEPVAGIYGIAQSLNPMAQPGAGAKAVENARAAIRYAPKTEAGQRYMGNVADVVQPVAGVIGGAEDWLGDTAFELTGSPAIAAAAKTAPTAMMEILGLGTAKYLTRSGKTAKEMRELMTRSAPSADELKRISSSIYDELDNMGVKVNESAYATLARRIENTAKRAGADPDVTPATSKAVARVTEKIGDEVTLSDLDTLREVAKNAASSTTNSREAMLGSMIIDKIDEFLETSGSAQLSVPTAISTGEVGARFKVARDLWGRQKKSKMIEQALADADIQASGLENGIRIQFRQILKNPKKRKFFNEAERAEMKKIVEGTTGANLAKLLGRFGMTEGNATNIIGGSIAGAAGATAGSAIAGPVGGFVGAAGVMGAGQFSRKLAQRLTAGNAQFLDEIVRAGKSGEEITKAYFANTPKAQRSARELSQLLAMPDVALDIIGSDDLVKTAVEIANKQKALAGAAIAGAAKPEEQD